MSEKSKKQIRIPFIIALSAIAVLGVGCIAVNAADKAAQDKEAAWKKELEQLTWEQFAADPVKYGGNPESLNDLYSGQTEGGVCNHDETFTEPVIPDGKYYPNGDSSAEYYLEISGDTMCFKDKNGGYFGSDSGLNAVWHGERKYKVITSHMNDVTMLCSEWEDAAFLPGCPYLDKYRILHGTQVDFDESGNAYISSVAIGGTEAGVKLYKI